MTTKICRSCAINKPTVEFAKCTNCKDGYQRLCKKCWHLRYNTKEFKFPVSQSIDENIDVKELITINNEYNTPCEQILHPDKLSEEQKDLMKRRWKMGPYRETIADPERLREIFKNDVFKIHSEGQIRRYRSKDTKPRPKYGKVKGGGYKQRAEALEKFKLDIENG